MRDRTEIALIAVAVVAVVVQAVALALWAGQVF